MRCAQKVVSAAKMIDQEKLKYLAPLALEWAAKQEALILKYGTPLRPAQIADAKRAGVQDVTRVRALIVDRISLPEDEQLAEAARSAQIITENSRAVTIGHGILIRADSWQDRELLIHALVHVAQCERCGGLDSFIAEYLSQRTNCANFSVGSLENEARQLARDICANAVSF